MGNDMASSQLSPAIQHLRRAALLRDGAGLTDAQLLEVYVRRREEAAMAALVRRHGPMVWGVCRRVLRNHHDAEDAFQATFLVFVRKAASLAIPELLANWLYGVAHQTALKARATTARRGARERQVTQMPEPAVTEQCLWDDLQSLLDQELSRLPDKYRVALVLCDLEGKTRKEAARQLGVPEGTLAARLARGRRMLALRLARHGLAVSGGSLAMLLAHNSASASVPGAVVGSTMRAASLFAAGQAAAGGALSAKAVAVAEGVLTTMFMTRLKIATAVLLGVGLLGIGWGLYPTRAAASPDGKPEVAPAPALVAGAPAGEVGTNTKDGPGEKKVSLPQGLPPVQVLVRLAKNGKLVVKTTSLMGLGMGPGAAPKLPAGLPPPVPGAPKLGGIGLMPATGVRESSYDLNEVQVLDTNGKKVSKKELAKRLKDETVAVAAFGGHPVDPLHLRVLKEGTLVLVLPAPMKGGLPFGGGPIFPGLTPLPPVPPDAGPPGPEPGE
jgi:RNA polymerase sigma factor (sigma-70 family)